MIALIPQVKYGPVHRNMDRLKALGKSANLFRADLLAVATAVKAGSFAAAADRFRAAREQCILCHAGIRELP
jgi:hypothetical protein